LPWISHWLYQDKGVNSGTPDDFWLETFRSLLIGENFYEVVVQGSGSGVLHRGYTSFSFQN
jgi:hypothetical protein